MKEKFSKNRLVLIGFRGAGKTTVGKELASLLNWRYVSTDAGIEEKSGMLIADFVNKNGWEAFRRIETGIIEGLSEQTEVVIDCGGGVVENERNLKNLQQDTLVVWVDAELSDIYQRLADAGDRPLLNQSDLNEDIKSNYQRRKPQYHKYSNLIVNSSRQSLHEICENILQYLGVKNYKDE